MLNQKEFLFFFLLPKHVFNVHVCVCVYAFGLERLVTKKKKETVT